MKTLTTNILTAAFVLLLFAAMTCRAQDISGPQQFLNSAINDGAVGGGFWRSLKGNYSIASYDYLYQLTSTNNILGAGLILGGDYMWTKGQGQQNDVKGGFALKYDMTLEAVGAPNTHVGIYGGTAVATPHNSSAGVGNITFACADMHWTLTKLGTHYLVGHINPGWQTRVGQGDFDRPYVGVQGFLSLGF